MLITISGPPGSGKSTVAAAVAEAFDLEHVSGGDIFRGLAEERGLSLAAFNELAEDDDAIDRDLDRRLRETAAERDDVVIESRLSGWMAGDYADLKVWLDAPLSVRAARIADREGTSVDRAEEETRVREESERKRYAEYYDIDFEDRSIYDLCVNTARWDAEAVIEIVEDSIRRYDPAVDEGATTVVARYEF
ncbi:MAG TPA: AAA family ATPase [Halobacteriales archaeon]|nr:AAA family ATPase [Halobacteriales archaeon]